VATLLTYFFLGDVLLKTNKTRDAMLMALIGLGLAGFLTWLLNDGIKKSERGGNSSKAE